MLVTDNAAETFEILAKSRVGVVLCDQRMPCMSGTEFLSRVKQMYPAITRMILSGYSDLQSVTEAVNHGAIFKFLTKPWDDGELQEALDDAFHEFEKNENKQGQETRSQVAGCVTVAGEAHPEVFV